MDIAIFILHHIFNLVNTKSCFSLVFYQIIVCLLNFFCQIILLRFTHKNKIWRSNVIFYNNNLNWWYVYNRDNKQYVEFGEMDTDNQIKMLEMLENNLEL